ncbi:hypothetical protein BG006_008404 [Podila minutissima]|uniref:Uncharacterized protein n=1 Tax=Podila minutissima TaxID=64525 RepID=A0A9P5VJL8_9FUNG|nr:hypothetical protein BG006_008404 [Podila minutissima]
MLSTIAKAIVPLRASPTYASSGPSSRHHTSSTSSSRHQHLASFSFWATLAIVCVSVLSSSSTSPMVVHAAHPRHTPAPANLINAMGFALSETSPLSLQLQLEAAVAGTQKLAYLPTSGPAMDFYYLNYRPSYRAGHSKIDFWMLTPKGSTPPKSGSLELYDEFGKILLATLVPEGTVIPQGAANKNEPFLWKSWAIPATLKADFDFSEKFRVVLKTSDTHAAVATAAKVNNKKKKIGKRADAAGPEKVAVQDRQFRIKGLKATPGGQPNPAKVRANHVVEAPPASSANTVPASNANLDTKIPNSKASDASGSLNDDGSQPEASAASAQRDSRPVLTLLVIAFATVASFC